jgi:hypothetical protein
MERPQVTKVSSAGRSNYPSRFSKGRADPYGGRLLPVCCPDAQTPPLER